MRSPAPIPVCARVTVLILSLILPLSLPLAALAQPIPNSAVSPDNGKSKQTQINFRPVLEQLSRRLQCTVITEGWPITDEIDSALIASLLEGEKQEIRPADVARIAEMFDYSVERHRNVLLLRKRYSQPEDLPAVTLEECYESVRDLQTVISPFCQNFKIGATSSDPITKQLIKSLTPGQLAAMEDANQGLPLDNLSSAQRAATWRLAQHFFIGNSERTVRAAQHHLTSVMKNEVSIGWPQRSRTRVLGYELPNLEGNGKVFRQFTYDHGQLSLDGTAFRRPFAFLSEPPSGTENGPTSAPPRPFPVSNLREQINELNARTGGQAGTSQAVVDDSLASKPLFLIGSEYASSDEILRGLTELFGLRLVKSADNELRITRRKIRPAQSPTDIPAGIRDALPLSILQALFVDSTGEVDATTAGPSGLSSFVPRVPTRNPVPGSPTRNTPIGLVRKSQLAEQRRALKRAVVVRQLRRAFQELVQRERREHLERVNIEHFNLEERTAFALMVMTDCISEINVLFGPTPEYISKFDTVVLTGGLSNAAGGNRLFSLLLRHRTAEGTVARFGPGFGQVQYDKLDSPLYQ